jgi:hypothetical protein
MALFHGISVIVNLESVMRFGLNIRKLTFHGEVLGHGGSGCGDPKLP